MKSDEFTFPTLEIKLFNSWLEAGQEGMNQTPDCSELDPSNTWSHSETSDIKTDGGSFTDKNQLLGIKYGMLGAPSPLHL